MKQKVSPGQKIICLNRKASFNYFFLELFEAGIALKGSEVKSLRDGKASIADSYAVDKNGEDAAHAYDPVTEEFRVGRPTKSGYGFDIQTIGDLNGWQLMGEYRTMIKEVMAEFKARESV